MSDFSKLVTDTAALSADRSCSVLSVLGFAKISTLMCYDLQLFSERGSEVE